MLLFYYTTNSCIIFIKNILLKVLKTIKLSKRLKQLREEKGLLQIDIAKILNITTVPMIITNKGKGN